MVMLTRGHVNDARLMLTCRVEGGELKVYILDHRRHTLLLYLQLSLDELPNIHSSIHYSNPHIQQDVRQPVPRCQLPDSVCRPQRRPERCSQGT